MANPNFPVNGQSERVDALIDSAGSVFLKLGIGSVNFGGTNNAAWHGAATHKDGATFAANDGVSVAAGLDSTTVRKIIVDSSGRQIVVGAAAAGSAVAGNPVMAGGSDGTNVRALATDASGHQQIVEGRVTDGSGTFTTLRIPNIFKSVTSVTANGDTAIWTPTSGKKFRLMRFLVMISAEAARTTGGSLIMKFRDATTDIGFGIQPFIPTTSVTTGYGAFTTGWIDLGNGFLSAAANNVLNWNLAAALTAGNVTVDVAGTEE